jgi:spore coat protein U-like protein
MSRHPISRRAALIFVVLLWPAAATATCSGLGCSCSVSASNVNFGVFNPLSGSALDGSGNIQVTCSALVAVSASYEIRLSKGGGSYSLRKLQGPTGAINYNLYTNASRSLIWGDGTSSTFTVSDTISSLLTSANKTHTVYGRIPSGQTTVAPGTYTDSIIATIIF